MRQYPYRLCRFASNRQPPSPCFSARSGQAVAIRQIIVGSDRDTEICFSRPDKVPLPGVWRIAGGATLFIEGNDLDAWPPIPNLGVLSIEQVGRDCAFVQGAILVQEVRD